jgi:tetratricopeptide (TPR) repeat protein
MRHTTALSILTVVLILAAPVAALAQAGGGGGSGGGQPTPPADPSDCAISAAVAWKKSTATTILDENMEKLGGKAGFKTAQALVLVIDNKLDQAVPALANAAAADTKDPAPEYYRGEVLFWKKKNDDAKAAWLAAQKRAQALVAAEPENARARYYLGAALIRLNKLSDARTQLAEANNRGYDPKMVNLQIGLSYIFEKKWAEARDALNKVIEADNLCAPALFYRALVWNQLNRKDNMVNDLDQFIKIAPVHPDAETARAMLATVKR